MIDGYRVGFEFRMFDDHADHAIGFRISRLTGRERSRFENPTVATGRQPDVVRVRPCPSSLGVFGHVQLSSPTLTVSHNNYTLVPFVPSVRSGFANAGSQRPHGHVTIEFLA